MRHHRNADEDTDTGLPRKTITKAMKWALRILGLSVLGGLGWFAGHLESELREVRQSIQAGTEAQEKYNKELNTRLSRIEGKLNIMVYSPPDLMQTRYVP